MAGRLKAFVRDADNFPLVFLISMLFIWFVAGGLLNLLLGYKPLYRLFVGDAEETILAIGFVLFFYIIPIVLIIGTIVWAAGHDAFRGPAPPAVRWGALLLLGVVVFVLSMPTRSSVVIRQASQNWNYFFGETVPRGVRVVGTQLQIYGGINRAMVPQLETLIAQNPSIKVVQLESDGGHWAPASHLRDIIRSKGLDTLVSYNCRAACITVFLGGRQRWLWKDAKLGFASPAIFDIRMRGAEEDLKADARRQGLSDVMIERLYSARALHYPPQKLLQDAHVVSGVLPAGAKPPA